MAGSNSKPIFIGLIASAFLGGLPFFAFGQLMLNKPSGESFSQLKTRVYQSSKSNRLARINAIMQPNLLGQMPRQMSTMLPQQPNGIPVWSADCLPFFCKIEHNLGKKIPIMLKFRLGSVEYVDWMEGKPNTSGGF